MRSVLLLASGIALAVLAGCASPTVRPDAPYRAVAKVRVPVIPPQGLIFTHMKAPLSLEPTGFGTKKGTATSHQIGLPPLPYPGLASGLDLFAWGDASKETAAANGGIQHVEHADYDMTVVLFIFRTFTTEVYGN